jgi:hemolysin activation/secretion protein
VFGKALDYTLTVSGQWSGQELPPSEQFSVGGRGTVRGFQEDSLYGNRGAFIRNELSRTILQMPNFRIAGYAGVDAGRIGFPATKTWDGHSVVGSTVGVRGKLTDYFDFDVAYARSLLRPEDFKAKRDLLYFTVTAAY